MTRKGGGYIHVLLMVWKPILTSCRRILDSNSLLSSLGVALCSMFAMSLQWPSVLSISTSHKNMRLVVGEGWTQTLCYPLSVWLCALCLQC
jgi:hypothetical protein